MEKIIPMLFGALLILIGIVLGYFLATKWKDLVPRSEFADYQMQDAVGRLMLAETTFAKAQKAMHDRIIRDQAVGIEAALTEIHALQQIPGAAELTRDHIRRLKSAVTTIREHPELFSRPEMETYPPGHADYFVKHLEEVLVYIDDLPVPDEASNKPEQPSPTTR